MATQLACLLNFAFLHDSSTSKTDSSLPTCKGTTDKCSAITKLLSVTVRPGQSVNTEGTTSVTQLFYWPATARRQYLLSTGAKWYNWHTMESQALRVVSEPNAAIGIAQDPASAFHAFELENMLMKHARWATRLAGLASDVETRWWLFARDAEASHIPAALGISIR